MKADRLILPLLIVAILLQAAILFRGRLANAPAPSRASERNIDFSADLTGLPIRGDSRTNLIMIEFSDYECQFCQRHARDVGKQIHERYVRTGKMRHALANAPSSAHTNARVLATAAICAGQQSRYWEMSDKLFEGVSPQTDQKDANAKAMVLAKTLGLDTAMFGQCLSSSLPGKEIERDLEIASRLQLSGTPMFALGTVDGSGRVKLRKVIAGAQPLDVFEKAIAEFLE